VRTESKVVPLMVTVTDVPPHPASPEGRLLKSERIPSPISVEEQHPLTGGLHRW
jgi:hypothetical protein